jgi:mono/diheme cytochrome c family protein
MGKFICGVVLGVLISPILLTVVLLSGLAPVHATADPQHWETLIARKAFTESVARHAPKVQNPVVPTSSNLRSGLKIYRDSCAGCHGDSGKPSHWGTAGFYPRVPQFDIEPPLKSDWQMFWIVKHGVRYTGMGAWEGEMSDENIWMVVTFLNNLRNLPPEIKAEWRAQEQPH